MLEWSCLLNLSHADTRRRVSKRLPRREGPLGNADRLADALAVSALSLSTWAGLGPGLIIVDHWSLVSPVKSRGVVRMLSYCHVLYDKDMRKGTVS